MKKNWYTFIICCLVVALSACQNEDELSSSNVGYLRLSLGVNASTNTRADEEIYNPEQIAVQIVSEEGEVVKETSDWEDWANLQIALPVGNYTLKASSAGFDGATSGFDKPYYAGSESIVIEKDKEVNKTITCTLANVKVTVNFEQSFLDVFDEAKVEVDDNADNAGIDPLTFVMGETGKSGYFPVTDLKAVVSATNKKGITNSQTNEIKDVKARDHYILNYRVEGGDGNVTVTVDPTTKTYTYTFNISMDSELVVDTANAWAKFAYLSGNIVNAKDADPSEMKFQYRKKDAAEWISVTAVQNDTVYTAYEGVAPSLDPQTTYEYRMVYGEEELVSEVKKFTTEAATALQNGGFEDWYQAGKIWYASTKSDYENGTYMWDTSNPGSGNFGFNPTIQSTTVKHSGSSAAKLETQYAFIKLAAASLYYGRFGGLVGLSGAKIDFGQPFVSRPISLKGYYQYDPNLLDGKDEEGKKRTEISADQPANTVKDGDSDLCSIYIILSKGTHQVNNTDTETLLTAENVWKNEQFIAYGELPAEQCVDTKGEWEDFNIPLQYKEDQLGEKPTHLIVVCSSSKYGDYFTGAIGSTLYLDDFELVYDGEPTIWK